MNTRKLLVFETHIPIAAAIRTKLLNCAENEYDVSQAYMSNGQPMRYRDSICVSVDLCLENKHHDHLGLLKRFPVPIDLMEQLGSGKDEWRLYVPKAYNSSEVGMFSLSTAVKEESVTPKYRLQELGTTRMHRANQVPCRWMVIVTPGDVIRMVNIIDDLKRHENNKLNTTPDIFIPELYDALNVLKVHSTYYSGAVVLDCFTGRLWLACGTPKYHRTSFLEQYGIARMCYDENNRDIGLMLL